MRSSVHANNKRSNILVLGEGFTQGLDNTTIYADKFCLSLHYNADDSYLFVNGKEIINFKAKDSEIVPYPLCLGGLSKDFSPSKTDKIGLGGYV